MENPQEIMEMQKQNCIFCKIIKGEIPSHEIYSDDKVKVILDINPANEGHCLVLPKDHYQILPQIPPELIGHMFLMAKRTSRTLLKALGVKGTSVFVANGAVAGQKAPHFMIHVIPRRPNDMMFDMPKSSIPEKELVELKNGLQAALSGKSSTVQKETQAKEDKPEPQMEKSEEQNKPNDEDIDIDKISEMFG